LISLAVGSFSAEPLLDQAIILWYKVFKLAKAAEVVDLLVVHRVIFTIIISVLIPFAWTLFVPWIILFLFVIWLFKDIRVLLLAVHFGRNLHIALALDIVHLGLVQSDFIQIFLTCPLVSVHLIKDILNIGCHLQESIWSSWSFCFFLLWWLWRVERGLGECEDRLGMLAVIGGTHNFIQGVLHRLVRLALSVQDLVRGRLGSILKHKQFTVALVDGECALLHRASLELGRGVESYLRYLLLEVQLVLVLLGKE